jgi:hypothetical protein
MQSMSQAETINITGVPGDDPGHHLSSRRGFLALAAGGAVAAAIPTAAATAEADPIFAVIERHRAESRAYEEAIRDQDKLYEIVPEEIRRGPRVQFGLKDGVKSVLFVLSRADRAQAGVDA